MKALNYQSLAIVVAALVVALAVTLAAVPLVRRLAIRMGAIDMPGVTGTDSERHLHKEPTPRMGGLAIFAGFLVAVLLLVQLNTRLTAMLLGAVIIVVLGMVDDVRGLPALLKFGVQIVAALVAVAGGNVISYVSAPTWIAESGHLNLGILSVPVSVLWIVLITNAVNLIDGLDGLAAGVSGISSVCLLIVAMGYSDITVAVLCAALAGGCIGFLPYNISPARIFMGDTGSTFIGFILAVASIQGLFKIYALISFAVPFCLLGLPIFDVCYAVIARVSHGENPMKADRKHIHYRLLDMGLTRQQTVAVLYIISGILGLIAVLLSTSEGGRWIPLVIAVIIVGVVAYQLFHHRRALLKGEDHRKHFPNTDVRLPHQKNTKEK
ncbi:MAG: undecaprenyl/decaprenyl-phosphate alpha-N-acetylglucosaminyl 1-phosphate transferase [Clostridiales bacterium]|nr:undecaprenyl/decaprenyl-phosphate alpha-N-acetylglucosaminyl 1-phosphate transferase [Clostridiales bacterium]